MKQIELAITRLSFSLRSVSFAGLAEFYRSQTDELSDLERHAGTGSDAFSQAYKRIREAASRGKPIEQELKDRLSLRAYAIALSNEQIRNLGISQRILDAIESIQPVPSRLLTEALTKLYFDRYDQLAARKELAEFIVEVKRARNEVSKEENLLFGDNAPMRLAEYGAANRLDLAEVCRELKLADYGSGRFHQVCQYCYYIKQIQALAPNQEHDVIYETMQPRAYEDRYDQGFLLGHKVLEQLIDKVPASSELSPLWERCILVIAGDPRMPPGDRTFRKWWHPLGEARINKGRGWFSRLDLKIFLKVFERFAKEQGDNTMIRMYGERKQMLEALFDAGYVKNSRLYLTSAASQFVRQYYDKDELPMYSITKGNPASLIFLNLGNVCLMEGSHNAKLWIFPKLSPKAIVNDYSVTEAQYSELTQNMSCTNHADGYGVAEAIIHNKGWQFEAIDTLRSLDIYISPEAVVSKSEYMSYIRRKGY